MKSSLCSKVWKFHNFSITQILREINIWDSRSAKYTILTHLEALNVYFHDFLQFMMAQFTKLAKLKPLKLQNGSFGASKFSPKFISCKIRVAEKS